MSSDPQFIARRAQAVDGTVLGAHEVEGEGSLVVGLHGFTGSAETMLPLLDAVRDGRPAIAIDIVGHGNSDAPDYLETYSMASVVDQVLSVIGPREPNSVHLIGYSMGGRIAISLGARAPWYFASITSLSATAGIDDPIERAERHNADLALADHLEQIGVENFITEWLANPLFATYVASLDEATRANTIEQRTQNMASGLANSLRGTGTGAMPPVWTMLSALRSPFLAVAGELDTGYVEIAKAMADAAWNGSYEVISAAGHVVHNENFHEVADVVAKFLQSCDYDKTEGGPA